MTTTAIPRDVQYAIARSNLHNEIVTLPYSDERALALCELCDGWTETNDGAEYWAADQGDAAMAWRVNLTLTPEAPEPENYDEDND